MTFHELCEARSQAVVADAIGCSQPTISKMLRRERPPHIKVVQRVARFWPELDVSRSMTEWHKEARRRYGAEVDAA
jgi:transcriptional regulator with XRE-family HTH domain